MRSKAPRVYVRSYKITSNEALNRLKSYIDIGAKKDADQFYKNLYGKIASVEDTFWFPYFSDSVRSFTNNYGDTFQAGLLGTIDSFAQASFKNLGGLDATNPIDNIQQVAKNAGAAAAQAGSDLASGRDLREIMGNAMKQMGTGYTSTPGSYIETPKLYEYAQNDSGLDVSFILSNTINSDYSKNAKLVKHLTKINRPLRRNSIEMEPPRIYKVKVPGIRYIEWAYCSNFSVNLLGTKRMIGEELIPEGYRIDMSFTSLTTEVSNFMDKV